MFEPSYIRLLNEKKIERRVEDAIQKLEGCKLCPRECNADRLRDEKGFCRTGRTAYVSSHNLHHGEEPPISGTRGSGTIFFSNCNMRCKFCQNYPISQLGTGEPAPADKLAGMMLSLQERGAHNINLVTPSHVVPQFIEALYSAVERGLQIPIVYNSSGYDGLRSLKLLDGIIDIYMPDIKYFSSEHADYCSHAPDYFEHARHALKEMHRQVGALKVNSNGIATRGMLIRHLVLPNGLADSERLFEFVATELGTDVPVNLMSQYFPAWKATEDERLNRRITEKEYDDALSSLQKWKLNSGWTQEIS